MPNVAIIGTQGAGKTVFITTLAHHLMRNETNSISLDAHQNARTQKYIETNWHQMQHREWPAHTVAGQSPDLRWNLMVNGQNAGQLRVIDASGHDIRLIYSDPLTIPDPLKPLAAYCQASDVAIFVVNLADYIERPGSIDHIENEVVLKSALDYVKKNGKKRCIVFAQGDVHKAYIATIKGDSETERWLSAVRQHIGTVYTQHLAEDTPISDTPLFPVACVAQTEKIVEEGGIRLVPKPGFASEGLEPFLDWLSESVTPPPSTLPQPTLPPRREPWPIWVAGIIGYVFFLGSCYKKVSHFIGRDTVELNSTGFWLGPLVFFIVWGILLAIQRANR